MHLVVDHVLESLVEGGSQEDHDLHLLSCEAIVHDLVASHLVAQSMQLFGDCLHGVLGLNILEWCGITLFALESCNLRREALDQVADGHPGRDGVGIDDQVRDDSFLSEWHVLLRVSHANCTFLAVARGKLVSDVRDSDGSHLDFGEVVAVSVQGEEHLVDFAVLGVLQLSGNVFAILQNRVSGPKLGHSILRARHDFIIAVHGLLDGCSLADDYVVTTHSGPWLDQTILVKLVVGSVSTSQSLPVVRHLETLVFRFQSIGVGAEEGRPEYSSVNTRLVANDGVLLVVASVASDGHDCVAPSGELFEVEEIHTLGADQWLLGIVEDMSQSVHPQEVVAGVDAHGLLSHCTLIGVSWRLIVVGERNDACANSEYHGWVDLTVGVSTLLAFLAQITHVHGDHCGFLLLNIQVLHQAFLETVLKVHQVGGRAREQLSDVLLAKLDLTVFNDEQRSLDSSSICEEAYLLVGDVSHDGYLRRDLLPAA